MIAMQNGVTYTRAYRHRVLKERPQCRRCIVSRCSVYDFKDRHDRKLFHLVKGVARVLKLTT